MYVLCIESVSSEVLLYLYFCWDYTWCVKLRYMYVYIIIPRHMCWSWLIIYEYKNIVKINWVKIICVKYILITTRTTNVLYTICVWTTTYVLAYINMLSLDCIHKNEAYVLHRVLVLLWHFRITFSLHLSFCQQELNL